MKLAYSPASPYVRKVNACAIARGIDGQIERWKVATTDPALVAFNPLSKVPTLILDDGTMLYDSPVICEYLDSDGSELIAAIRRATGNLRFKVRHLPWTLLRAVSPVVPLFRELNEMRYLWKTPVRLSNARLVGMLGAEPHTPLDDAVRDTLLGLGCIAAVKA